MEAVIRTTTEFLKKLRDMGVEIICTDNEAVLPAPFTHQAIQAEVRRYLHLFDTATETGIYELTRAVIYRMKKALQVDGSLSWEEVWEIIGACYAAQSENRKRKEQRERSKALWRQQHLYVPTGRKSPF